MPFQTDKDIESLDSTTFPYFEKYTHNGSRMSFSATCGSRYENKLRIRRRQAETPSIPEKRNKDLFH